MFFSDLFKIKLNRRFSSHCGQNNEKGGDLKVWQGKKFEFFYVSVTPTHVLMSSWEPSTVVRQLSQREKKFGEVKKPEPEKMAEDFKKFGLSGTRRLLGEDSSSLSRWRPSEDLKRWVHKFISPPLKPVRTCHFSAQNISFPFSTNNLTNQGAA